MKGQIMSEELLYRRGGAFTGSTGFPGHSRTMGVHGTAVIQEYKSWPYYLDRHSVPPKNVDMIMFHFGLL